MRRTGRLLAAVLWFGIEGGWVYYVVLGAYAALVALALWLFSRGALLPAVAGCFVLIDGLALTLFLLHRWLTRRLRRMAKGARDYHAQG